MTELPFFQFDHIELGLAEIASQESPFSLCSGHSLNSAHLQYKSFKTGTGPVKNWHLIFHGLSGSHRVEEWWPQLLNYDSSIAERGDAIICFNSLGSCYGSTGPASICPESKMQYGLSFPYFDIYDSVKAIYRALQVLGISSLKSASGGSFGGMQAIAFGLSFPEFVEFVISIAGCPVPPLSRSLLGIQRNLALKAVQKEKHENRECLHFFAAARFIQYGTCIAHEVSQERFPVDLQSDSPMSWERCGGMQYQDILDKCTDFSTRFNAFSFIILNSLVETFQLKPVYAFKKPPKVLLIGIENDFLTPLSEIVRLAGALESMGFNPKVETISSIHGHSGWLFEALRFIEKMRNFVGDRFIHVKL
jgi:homoserine O-acetyltransferase